MQEMNITFGGKQYHRELMAGLAEKLGGRERRGKKEVGNRSGDFRVGTNGGEVEVMREEGKRPREQQQKRAGNRDA